MCILHSYYYSCRHHKRDIFDCKKHRKHPNRRLYCSKPVQEAERLGRWCPRCQNGEMSPNDPDEEDEHGTDSEWEGEDEVEGEEESEEDGDKEKGKEKGRE